MGKKPVYFTVVGGRLLFASEVKALLEHPDVPRRLDLAALGQFLTFSNVPEPATLFEGIRKLPAGHFLTCDAAGEVSVRRYWSPLDGPAWTAPRDRGEAVERVRHLVHEAVRKRLMADVPVGAFLSGGVDSSTNVALMSRLVHTPLQTFTVEFTGFGPDENFHDVPYARQVASLFGCRHTEVPVTAAEAIRRSARPVAFTHTGCAALADHPRNRTDAELRAVADKGGVSGIYVMPYLSGGRQPAAADVVRHIEHAVNVAGEEHVSIGTDGTLSTIALTPEFVRSFTANVARRKAAGIAAPQESEEGYLFANDLNTPRRFERLAARLKRRGHSDDRIEKILGANLLRVFGAAWNA
jgi:hypothetical protein